MKKLGKNRLLRDQLHLSATILVWWRQPVASVIALNPLFWAMCTVRYRRIAMAIGMASNHCAFFVFFVACDPVRLLGQYRAISRPMVASSGFQDSHEPPPSSDVHRIVLPDQHGHRKGP
jgi:hypothetical protein